MLHRYRWGSDKEVHVNRLEQYLALWLNRTIVVNAFSKHKVPILGWLVMRFVEDTEGSRGRKQGKSRGKWGPREGPSRVWHNRGDMSSPAWVWCIHKSQLVLLPPKADLAANDLPRATCLGIVHAHGDEGTWDACRIFLWFTGLWTELRGPCYTLVFPKSTCPYCFSSNSLKDIV